MESGDAGIPRVDARPPVACRGVRLVKTGKGHLIPFVDGHVRKGANTAIRPRLPVTYREG